MDGMAGGGGGATSRDGFGSPGSGSVFFNLGISSTTACSEIGGTGGVSGFGVSGFCDGSFFFEGATTVTNIGETTGSGFTGAIGAFAVTTAGGTEAIALAGVPILGGVGLASPATGVGRELGDAATD